MRSGRCAVRLAVAADGAGRIAAEGHRPDHVQPQPASKLVSLRRNDRRETCDLKFVGASMQSQREVPPDRAARSRAAEGRGVVPGGRKDRSGGRPCPRRRTPPPVRSGVGSCSLRPRRGSRRGNLHLSLLARGDCLELVLPRKCQRTLDRCSYQEPTAGTALALHELQQIGIDLVFKGSAHAVRCARIDFQYRTFDEFR